MTNRLVVRNRLPMSLESYTVIKLYRYYCLLQQEEVYFIGNCAKLAWCGLWCLSNFCDTAFIVLSWR